MAYTLTTGTTGRSAITIADGSIDTTSTSIALPGRNYSGYGQPVDQDLIRLTEHFASTTQPPAVLTGQMWFNTTTTPGILQICYDGSNISNPLWLYVAVTSSNGDLAVAGNLTVAGNANFSGTVYLGPVSNVYITGGTPGQFLITNGSGNLSWGDTIPFANIDTLIGNSLTYTFGNIDTANGTTLTYIDGNITDLVGSNLTYTNANFVNANLTNANIANISGTNLTYVNGNITNANGTNLTYVNANLTNANGTTLTYVNGTITNANGTNLTYANAIITNGTVTNINGSNLTYTNGNITTANGTNLNYTNGNITNANGSTLTYINANLVNANGTNLNYTNGNITNGNITNANGSTLTYTSGTIFTANGTTLNYTNGNITNVYGTDLSYTNGNIINGNITNANGTALTYINANITNGNITNANGTLLSYTFANLTTANGTTLNYDNGNITYANGNTLTYLAGDIVNANGNVLTYTWGNIPNFTSSNVNITGGNISGNFVISNAVTFNNSGTGAASGITYDGSAPRTISWNTILTLGGSTNSSYIRSVNGVYGDPAGQVVLNITETNAGTNAARLAFVPVQDGYVWVVAGDPDPNLNGETWIWADGAWYQVTPYDTATYDARYLQLAGGTCTGPVSFNAGITTQTLTTGAVPTPGSITGTWTLTPGSSISGDIILANTVTFNNGGTGAVSGTTYNGSVSRVISWNSLGAASGNIGGWANVGLGPISNANVQITGGTAGQVLTTNGSGILSWNNITATAIANAVTFTTTGGAPAGVTYDGSLPRIIDYSTVGAAQAYGTNYYAIGISDAGNTRGMNPSTGVIYGSWTLSPGTVFQSTYADLAERFESDVPYEAGTVVELGGEREITAVRDELSDLVFGVVSAKAAFTMNGNAGDDKTHPAIAITGRVPVKVRGKIRKGDRLVSAGRGYARAAKNSSELTAFNTIGRALVDKATEDDGTVLAIVTIK